MSCNPLRFVEIMGCENHAATLGGQLGDDATNHVASIQIDSSGWLIEERDIGIGRESEGQGESLSLATRETTPCGGCSMLQPHLFKEASWVDSTVVQAAVVTNEGKHTCTRCDTAILQHDADAGT